MRLLAYKDIAGRLRFEDITAKDFSEKTHGILCASAMKSIKGKLSTGELLDGIAVFAKAYELAGMKNYAKLLSVKKLQGPLTWGYLTFATYRHSFSKIFGPIALKMVDAYIQRKRN